MYAALLSHNTIHPCHSTSAAALFCAATPHHSVALLEHLSAQSARELLVAVVPSLAPSRDTRAVGVCTMLV